jgi:hypothetical protein
MIFQPNPVVIFVAALIPVVLGFIWYNPSVFGTALGRQTQNEVVPYSIVHAVINYVLGVLLSFSMLSYVNHQMAVMQLFYSREGFGEEGSQVMQDVEQIARMVGDYHLSFGHGAIHGAMAAIFLFLPVITAIGLREGRSFKYLLIHFGFWLLSLVLMGGVLGEFGLVVNL